MFDPSLIANSTVTIDIENIPIIFETTELENYIENPPPPIVEARTTSTPLQDKTSRTIDSILQWPKTPERKGKRNVERVPFVLTSAKYNRLFLFL